MRTAYKVWSGIAAGVFCLVAVSDLSGGGTTAAAVSTAPAGLAVAAPAATTSPPPSSPVSTATTPPATTTVSRVVDGDTVELVDGSDVQLIGLDACDVSTSGGRDAKASLESYTLGQQVRLLPGGERDIDEGGRHLRRLETVYQGTTTDIASLLITLPTIRLQDGQGASPEYLGELRALDYGTRSCSGSIPSSSSSSSSSSDDSDTDLDGPSPGDQGLPDGALTGGYCKKKWWC